jgi:hypothetical protein
MKKKIGLTILWLVLMIPFLILVIQQFQNQFVLFQFFNIKIMWDKIKTICTAITPYIGILLCIYCIVRIWIKTPKERLEYEENKRIKKELKEKSIINKTKLQIEKRKKEIETLENRLN